MSFGDSQTRMTLEPDVGQNVDVVLDGTVGGTFRGAAIACYFGKAISRVGVAYYPVGGGSSLYMTSTSYLGDEPIGGTGDTTTLGPNADGNHVMYLDVIPADRVGLNIGINASAGNTIPASWRFTVIGSNNKKLGVHPV